MNMHVPVEAVFVVPATQNGADYIEHDVSLLLPVPQAPLFRRSTALGANHALAGDQTASEPLGGEGG